MNARRYFLAGMGAGSLPGLCAGAAPAAPAPGTMPSPPGLKRRHQFPNVELKTHTGQTVRFYDDLVRGRLVAINMMYAMCNATCPPVTFNLVRVQEMLGSRMGRDIFMYSLTVRPDQDGPDDLAHYAKIHRVKPGWLFLTGKPENVEKVRLALGFYDPDPAVDKDPTRHTGMVRIGNDAYDRWAHAPALATPEHIVSTIDRLDRRHRA